MTTNNATPLSAEEAQHCEAMPHKDKAFCDSVADKLDAIARGHHVVVPAAEIAALKADVKELVEALTLSLPLAKGYAAERRSVKSNVQIIESAQVILTKHRDKT